MEKKMEKKTPTVITSVDLHCEQPYSWRFNFNPNCIFYVSCRVINVPLISKSSRCRVESINRLFELVECLPSVYTRVLTSMVEIDGTLYDTPTASDYIWGDLLDVDKLYAYASFMNAANYYILTGSNYSEAESPMDEHVYAAVRRITLIGNREKFVRLYYRIDPSDEDSIKRAETEEMSWADQVNNFVLGDLLNFSGLFGNFVKALFFANEEDAKNSKFYPPTKYEYEVKNDGE